MDYIMMGFPKKEIFDGLHKCFFNDKNTKFPFLEIFDGLCNQVMWLSENENGECLYKQVMWLAKKGNLIDYIMMEFPFWEVFDGLHKQFICAFGNFF